METDPQAVGGRPSGGYHRAVLPALLRFGIAYVSLTIVPVLWSWAVPWVAEDVLKLVPPPPSGSGDTTWNYVLLGVNAVVASAVALVWTVLRRRDRALMPLFTLLVRAFLFKVSIAYGLMKLFKTQFPDASLVRLSTPTGELSPMGALWTMMGSSTAYCVFTGLLEIFGAALLVSRRTTTLGAIVLTGAMSNVVMLNLAYDVPVKQHSLHLLAGAVLLLVADGRRVFRVFVLGQSVAAAKLEPIFTTARLHRVGQAAKGILVVSVVLSSLSNVVRMRRYFVGVEPSPLYGIWDVERFEYADGSSPSCTDGDAWRRLVVAERRRAAIESESGERASYRASVDEDEGLLALKPALEDREPIEVDYERTDTEHLVLTGVVETCQVRVHLRRFDHHQYRLPRGEFHWVSQRPDNPWR